MYSYIRAVGKFYSFPFLRLSSTWVEIGRFLAVATGISSATSTHACIWCKCSKEDRGDTSREWALDDPADRNSHTIEENLAILKLPKTQRKWNVTNSPLFSTIPLRRVVLDTLHLFLCVSDVLEDCLLRQDLRECRITAKVKMTSGVVNMDKVYLFCISLHWSLMHMPPYNIQMSNSLPCMP